MAKRKTTEEFEQQIYNILGDEFCVLGDYINSDTKIKMFHKICKNEFEVTPHYFKKS